MEQIIATMLERPRKAYYTRQLCATLNLTSGTISPLLNRMEEAGWVASEFVSAAGSRRGAPRKYYRFTAGTAAMLRKAIAA